MLTVQFRGIVDAKDAVLGEISWDGESYLLDPYDSPLLHEALDQVLPVGDGVTWETPEEYLAGLHLQYRSAYLRATEAYDDSKVKA